MRRHYRGLTWLGHARRAGGAPVTLTCQNVHEGSICPCKEMSGEPKGAIAATSNVCAGMFSTKRICLEISPSPGKPKKGRK